MSTSAPQLPPPPPGPWAYLRAVAAVAVATVAGLLIYSPPALADVAMLYLVAVMVASLAGRGPSLLASSLAVAAFDVCFVEPRYTLVVDDPRHLLTFAVMFGAGLLISELIARLRRQELDVRLREAEAREAELRAHTEELRSSVLSAVSHDLRTPLSVVTGAATSLRDGGPGLGAAARADLLETIVEEAQRLERVLAHVLALSRVETGLVPTREWVPVEELVGTALSHLEDALGDRAVKVEVGDELAVPVDPVLFEQALINLIDNAVKHGQPPFEVRAVRRADTVEITVADRGAGVPPGSEGKVFDKFFRASASPGVGLGLAVVRGLIEAHGGTITVENRDGGGACFRIALPAVGEPPAPPSEELLAVAR